MRPADLRAFIADSLLLWRIDATVTDRDGAVLVDRGDRMPITVTRCEGPSTPLWWTIQAPGALPRPCPSVVVMLSALRTALGGTDSGTRLRIATPTGP